VADFTFRRAVRENVPLLIGLAGSSGSGKTYTAMRLATGMAGGKPFAVIDTEASRAKHYADAFTFDHGDLKAPFRPKTYEDAIAAADAAGYPVILVDSMSHEWAGTGGILDWQEEEYERLGAKDSIKLLSWSKPKKGHKDMVQRLLQIRAHLILCFRAEEKIDMVKVDGKTKIVPKEGPGGFKGWLPICEKNLPYELTTSILLHAEHPGVPDPIKLQQQHRHLFPEGKPITEETGRALAEWAAGGKVSAPQERSTNGPLEPLPGSAASSPSSPAAAGLITESQVADLKALCQDKGVAISAVLEKAEVTAIELITAADYPGAVRWVTRQQRAA
jgi:hypothetical protein